jgi:hypothetical protein
VPKFRPGKNLKDHLNWSVGLLPARFWAGFFNVCHDQRQYQYEQRRNNQDQ